MPMKASVSNEVHLGLGIFAGTMTYIGCILAGSAWWVAAIAAVAIAPAAWTLSKKLL